MNYQSQLNQIQNSKYLKQIFSSLDELLQNKNLHSYISAPERSKSQMHKLTHEPSLIDEALKAAVEFIKHSVNTNHPLFVNQLYAGAQPISWYAELIVAALNTSMATYEISPVATLMEKEIISQLGDLLNLKLDGLMVPGGSYANMLGLHLARYSKNPDVKMKGNQSCKFKIFISDQAHYSYKKAMNLMGLGQENIELIETDVRKKMSPQNLEFKIKQCLENGDIPLAVGSTFGTTVYGALDPIEEIQKICDQYQTWHHLDAAWGAPLIFSGDFPVEKSKKSFDSLTLDFHKSLGLTLCKSFLLTPHEKLLKEANHGGGDAYLFHETENEDFNTGSYALQCGRKVDSFPVWLSWKLIGTRGFKETYQKQRQLCLKAYELLKQEERVICLHEPEFLNLCFQVTPHEVGEDINIYQKKLRQNLIEQEQIFLNYSTQNNQVFFRWSFANQTTDVDHFKKALEHILKIKL